VSFSRRIRSKTRTTLLIRKDETSVGRCGRQCRWDPTAAPAVAGPARRIPLPPRPAPHRPSTSRRGYNRSSSAAAFRAHRKSTRDGASDPYSIPDPALPLRRSERTIGAILVGRSFSNPVPADAARGLAKNARTGSRLYFSTRPAGMTQRHDVEMLLGRLARPQGPAQVAGDSFICAHATANKCAGSRARANSFGVSIVSCAAQEEGGRNGPRGGARALRSSMGRARYPDKSACLVTLRLNSNRRVGHDPFRDPTRDVSTDGRAGWQRHHPCPNKPAWEHQHCLSSCCTWRRASSRGTLPSELPMCKTSSRGDPLSSWKDGEGIMDDFRRGGGNQPAYREERDSFDPNQRTFPA
jgi:hypothetical protein